MNKIFAAILLLLVVLGIVAQPAGVVPPNLTQLSPREFVDLSRIKAIRFSCAIGSDRIGFSMVLDNAVGFSLLPDSEKTLRGMFGINRDFQCSNAVDDGTSTTIQ